MTNDQRPVGDAGGTEGSTQTYGRQASVADGSTFAPGLALLEPDVRAEVQSLYGVLRSLDDLVDEDDPRAPDRVDAVERWARGDDADTPETQALQELAGRRWLPRGHLLDFCAGMRHDIARARIETDEDFDRYCHQAGGSVGVVLAHLLGTADEGLDGSASGRSDIQDGGKSDAMRELEGKMETLGRAMQVTNILRDIDEDLAHGRLYIPATAIERFGFPAPGAREQLLRAMIARADALYDQGAGAIPLLRSGRAAMALSAALYREILRQIERDGFGRRAGRAVVPPSRRRVLIAEHRALDDEL